MQLAKPLTIAFCLLFLLSAAAIAQRPEHRLTATGLSLEVVYYKDIPPAFQVVQPEGGKPSGAWYGRFRAMILGRKLALTRLLPVFASVDEASLKEQDRSAQLRAFKESVLAVSDEAAEETLAQLRGEFPGLDLKKQAELKKRMESAVHYVKRDLVKELDTFEASAESDVHVWLEKVGERYRSWLSRL